MRRISQILCASLRDSFYLNGMERSGHKVLLLNSSYEPLRFIDQYRAINLLLKDKVDVVDSWSHSIRSVNENFSVPAIIRLRYYISHKRSVPRFQKKAIFARDLWTCQYCNSRLSYSAATIDHVFPKSRGGETSWFNCVIACKKCNTRKGSKTLDEANMQLRKQPTVPGYHAFWNLQNLTNWHPSWQQFLPSWITLMKPTNS